MRRLRVGVVGVGYLGQHHARVLAGQPGVELVGVVDRRPDQAQLVADRHGVPAHTDYQALLGRVDAVSIAVPTSFHREVAEAFLERGTACLVEKPLAPTLDDARAIVEAARRHGATLQVGHIERFNPALGVLRGLGVVPKYITGERLGTYTFRSTDIGVVLDLMIHDIDLVLSMVPAEVVSVSAVGVSVFGGHEDVANARIDFADGCVANLTASRVSYQTARKMRIWGGEGYVTIDFAARQGTLVRPSDRLRRGEVDLEGVDMAQPEAVRQRVFGQILRVDHVHAEANVEPLQRELEAFIHSARTGERPVVDGEDALKAIRVADQVLRSLGEHAWGEGHVGSLGLVATARTRNPL